MVGWERLLTTQDPAQRAVLAATLEAAHDSWMEQRLLDQAFVRDAITIGVANGIGKAFSKK